MLFSSSGAPGATIRTIPGFHARDPAEDAGYAYPSDAQLRRDDQRRLHDEYGQREAVATWLGTAGGDPVPPASAFCSDRTVRIAANPKLQWNGWSPASGNTRFQTAEEAGLTLEGVAT